VPDLQKILDQWAMVRAAPVPFITVSAAIAAAIWFAVSFSYSTRLSNRDAEISLLTRQRDDYRDKLGGATPDQAKAKIETLERTVHLVVGSAWEPLTRAEIERLASNLSGIPPKFINIIYENQLGKELGQTIHEAFKLAKWPEAFLSQGAGLGVGIALGYGSGTALKIKGAIEASTKLRPTLQAPDEPDGNASFVVFIGINHN
jgi:hypothetical protein